ncbi:hypothetical protein IMZ31_22230 (plasmid) [Pontibacillus sp. ALD_SL1]|uniref:hypothetical protein n=1 Tax=Pontibacillus sp. ALD_SL1 TaxID=2777185 RepID=UPI001A95952F|nr:hypothetical protein [Pontibacillus sp. ALD_SL1]QST02173.1 hypothetical protein IMZ31_22230 [Pontibacillus sp. ALD_SL1]
MNDPFGYVFADKNHVILIQVNSHDGELVGRVKIIEIEKDYNKYKMNEQLSSFTGKVSGESLSFTFGDGMFKSNVIGDFTHGNIILYSELIEDNEKMIFNSISEEEYQRKKEELNKDIEKKNEEIKKREIEEQRAREKEAKEKKMQDHIDLLYAGFESNGPFEETMESKVKIVDKKIEEQQEELEQLIDTYEKDMDMVKNKEFGFGYGNMDMNYEVSDVSYKKTLAEDEIKIIEDFLEDAKEYETLMNKAFNAYLKLAKDLDAEVFIKRSTVENAIENRNKTIHKYESILLEKYNETDNILSEAKRYEEEMKIAIDQAEK